MTLQKLSLFRNSLLFTFATILTVLMTALSMLFVFSGQKVKKSIQLKEGKRAFLANKENALKFYKVFSAGYDFLNPQFYTGVMRGQIVDLVQGECLRVLDVGCGTGYTTEGLLGHEGVVEVVGLDMNSVQLGRASKKLHRKNNRVSFSRGDAENLPFGDNLFDVVVSIGAIEYFPDPDRAIFEMARVVKQGGLVVVGGPEYGWFRKVALDKFFYSPSMDETTEMLSKSGLKDEKSFLVGVKTIFGTGGYVIVGTGRKA